MEKRYTKVGTIIGLAVGSIIGLVVSQSVFLLSASSQVFAIGVLIAFSLIFAAFGSFMGVLFDIDAQERGVNKTVIAQTQQVKQQRVKTQPLPIIR